jgi:hypothetical protein
MLKASANKNSIGPSHICQRSGYPALYAATRRYSYCVMRRALGYDIFLKNLLHDLSFCVMIYYKRRRSSHAMHLDHFVPWVPKCVLALCLRHSEDISYAAL